MECLIRKTDDELQIVYGEVYAPNIPDVHGEFMTSVEVRKMAHRFLAEGRTKQCDTNHDNNVNGSVIVESYIARDDDTTFIPESWVIGMHVPDPDMWGKVKKGEINGFSFEGLVHLKQRVIEMEIPDVLQGTTLTKSSEDSDEHTHRYEVRFSDEGAFMGGQTSTEDGHFHLIKKSTLTEPAPDGHTHRYSFTEQLTMTDEKAA